MANSPPLILRLMGTAIAAAESAGSIIKEVLVSGDLKTIDKGHNDPQTEADRQSQSFIMASLLKQYPKLHLIGEEGELEKMPPYKSEIVTRSDKQVLKLNCSDKLKNLKEEELVVWIDPLDGTSDFTKGILNSVTVLIGIAHDGKPIAGVIHQPFHNGEHGNTRTFWGIEGVGYGGFTPQLLPENSGLFIASSTSSHEEYKKINSLNPNKIIRSGGVGSEILLLLDGSVHAYIYMGSYAQKWDTCAPEAVIRAVGGQLTDIYGNNYSYSKNVAFPNINGILATAHQSYHETCSKAFSKVEL